MKDRQFHQVSVQVIENAKCETLYGFIDSKAEKGSNVVADDLKSHEGMVDFEHESVKYSVG